MENAPAVIADLYSCIYYISYNIIFFNRCCRIFVITESGVYRLLWFRYGSNRWRNTFVSEWKGEKAVRKKVLIWPECVAGLGMILKKEARKRCHKSGCAERRQQVENIL